MDQSLRRLGRAGVCFWKRFFPYDAIATVSLVASRYALRGWIRTNRNIRSSQAHLYFEPVRPRRIDVGGTGPRQSAGSGRCQGGAVFEVATPPADAPFV